MNPYSGIHTTEDRVHITPNRIYVGGDSIKLNMDNLDGFLQSLALKYDIKKLCFTPRAHGLVCWNRDKLSQETLKIFGPLETWPIWNDLLRQIRERRRYICTSRSTAGR